MTRFRLRFLLHEIDLPTGDFLIGRASTCQLTLDDPLVSRSHAILRIAPESTSIEDLGSRNGVRVNGDVIDGVQHLVDGDRIRIGTQQMVLRIISDEDGRSRRATGFLIHCPRCGVARPPGESICPSCSSGGLVEETDEAASTLHVAWNLELLVETMKRAESLGRTQDLGRLLLRAQNELQHTPEQLMDRRRLDQLAEVAVRYAVENGELRWAKWAISLYAAQGILPRPELGDRLSLLPVAERSSLAPNVDELTRNLRTHSPSSESEARILATLRALATEESSRS